MGEPNVSNLHCSEKERTHGELKYLSSRGK
jgi:hypothetical protein